MSKKLDRAPDNKPGKSVPGRTRQTGTVFAFMLLLLADTKYEEQSMTRYHNSQAGRQPRSEDAKIKFNGV
ncbi:MAG: hypothetical protein CVV42_04785 [Candidatus Riflebacteria bacterium HGW-Riflebacteria-2]|jgi:hypothetical protein|nr:MAG: hypothetical protein CVV42_04785 [Candidatus Riflebacteria bacterium HGW-Riflebacteria-2]